MSPDPLEITLYSFPPKLKILDRTMQLVHFWGALHWTVGKGGVL